MKFNYYVCDLMTISGIEKAEKLKAKGLKLISSTIFTVIYEETKGEQDEK